LKIPKEGTQIKVITALNLLKKHGLVNKHWKIRDLKYFRRYILYTVPLDDVTTWEGTIRHIMKLYYLDIDNNDLTEPIIIPEVRFSIGGTLKVDTTTGKTELVGGS